MHIHALMDNTGKVIFPKPLFLKKESVKVEIIIPDDALTSTKVYQQVDTVNTPTSAIRQQLNNILGKYAKKRSVSPAEDKAAWHQHLENKYL